MSSRQEVGVIQGLNYLSMASAVGVSDPESPAGKAGFLTGDLITEVNGKPIKYWREVSSLLLDQATTETLSFKVLRQAEGQKTPETIELSLAKPTNMQSDSEDLLSQLGLNRLDIFLGAIKEGSPAATAGLQSGDMIVRVGDTAVKQWQDIVDSVKSYSEGKPPLSVSVIRKGEQITLNVKPVLNVTMTHQGAEEERYMIGIVPPGSDAMPETVIARTSNPISALATGVEDSIDWTVMTVMSLVRVFQNKVSAKNIGGFISIAQMASTTFKIGITPFLKVMGVISINLFILNLLPVPVLDGGHLVFYSIEALRGAPLSMRKLEIAQQVGLILLLSLLIFTLFNDVSRILS
jgi:regulator of sigma E protease